MKIESLTIENFRGIEKLNLKFSPNEPTVLIGINGSGKSSVLDCFSTFLYSVIYQIRDAMDGGQINLSISPRKKPQYFVNVKRFFSRDFKNIEKKINVESTILFDSQKSNLVFSQQLLYSSNIPDNIKNFFETIHKKIVRGTVINLPVIIYYPVNRVVFDIPLGIPEEKENKEIYFPYQDMMKAKTIDFNTFFRWFRGVEDIENEERRDDSKYRDKALEAVRNAIKSLIPGFTNLRVRRSPLRMTVNKNEEELTIDQLSDGEKCLLAMVGDLARRLAIANPGREDPLQGEGIVLIDEIELHLHPQWQREIILALTRTFPNCQFIVTTHSPQVISHIKPKNIYVLESTPDGIVAKHPRSSFGRDSNQILEELMDTPARPQNIKERILELFRVIENGDLEKAKKLKEKIAKEIGIDDPEIIKSGVAIRRKEILQR